MLTMKATRAPDTDLHDVGSRAVEQPGTVAMLPGIRRVVFVRVVANGEGIRYVVEAISDRGRPVSRAVAPKTAMSVIRGGAPFIVRSS